MKHHTYQIRTRLSNGIASIGVCTVCTVRTYTGRLVRSAKTVIPDEYTQRKHCQGLLAAVKKFQLKFNCNGNNSTHEAPTIRPEPPPPPSSQPDTQSHSGIHDMRDNQMNLSSGEHKR